MNIHDALSCLFYSLATCAAIITGPLAWWLITDGLKNVEDRKTSRRQRRLDEVKDDYFGTEFAEITRHYGDNPEHP